VGGGRREEGGGGEEGEGGGGGGGGGVKKEIGQVCVVEEVVSEKRSRGVRVKKEEVEAENEVKVEERGGHVGSGGRRRARGGALGKGGGVLRGAVRVRSKK